MPLDTNIPLSLKGVTFPDYFSERRQVLADRQQQAMQEQQIQAAQAKNAEVARQANAEKASRGLMQVNDVSTTEGQSQYTKDLTKLGFGDLAQTQSDSFEDRNMALTKKRQDYAKQIFDVGNKYVSTAASHIKNLPPEQREQARASVIAEMQNLHLDPHDFAQAPLDDNTLTKFERISLAPKDRLDLEHKEAIAAIDKKHKDALESLEGSRLKNTIRHEKTMEDLYTRKAQAQADKKKEDLGSTRLTASYLSDWRHNMDAYEKAAAPYLAIKGIKNSESYGTGVGDQSMMDKLIMLETGHVPTEAQYKQMASNYGIVDILDKATGRIAEGAKLPQKVRNQIESEAEEQMRIVHDRHLALRDEKERQMISAGVNPESVLQSGEYFDKVGKMLDGGHAGSNQIKAPSGKTYTIEAKLTRLGAE